MTPTGWYGTICCICFAELTTADAYEDENGQKWDAHKGRCALLAGYVSADLKPEYDRLIAAVHAATGEEKHRALSAYYAFCDRYEKDHPTTPATS